MESELIVPGGAEYLATDTALAGVLAEQRRDHAPKHPHVFRSRAVLEPTVVFPEDHLQHPVQTVLNPPVSPGGATQFRCAASAAADVVGYLEGFLAALPGGPRHPDDGLQVVTVHTPGYSLADSCCLQRGHVAGASHSQG